MKYTDARYPEKINDLVNNDGTINMPEEGPVDNEAVAQEMKKFIESLDQAGLEAFDKVFRFEFATPECIESGFDTKYLVNIYELISQEKLYIISNFVGNSWQSEDSFETISCNPVFSLTIDSESGDCKLDATFEGYDVTAVSGTIRFNFDPNRGN